MIHVKILSGMFGVISRTVVVVVVPLGAMRTPFITLFQLCFGRSRYSFFERGGTSLSERNSGWVLIFVGNLM